MTTILSPPYVGGLTTTTGTGALVISSPMALPGGGGNFRQFNSLPNGSLLHVFRADVGAANFEREICSLSIVSGTATLTPVTRLETSAGGATPVSWSGGTQTVTTETGVFHPANGGIELQAYAAAFRASLGLDTASTLPASALGTVPAGAGTDGAWTGGSAGKAVRLASANTFTNAANTDTDAQLSLIAFLNSTGLYFAGAGLITGLSGLTAGAVYFLGTGGNMLSWVSGALPVTVTPGGSVKLVKLGVAPSTTSLFWQPVLLAKG